MKGILGKEPVKPRMGKGKMGGIRDVVEKVNGEYGMAV